MSGGTAREESDSEERLETGGDGGDADHPASTPRPFTEEEKAWGAALHSSRRWFSKSAMKEPPVPMRDQAQALGLTPQANGLLFSDTRAGRLHALIEMMLPGERTGYLKLAQERLAQWQLTQTDTGSDTSEIPGSDLHLSTSALTETPPTHQGLRPWRLPYDIALPSSHEESPQELAKAQALLREESVQHAHVLENTMVSFNVPVEVRPEDICIGPTVVRYGIRPTGIPETRPDERDTSKRVIVRDNAGNVQYKQRTRVNRVIALQNDIALTLEAKSIRMQAPVPERPYIGVEIPINNPSVVTFKEMLRSREFQTSLKKSKLCIPLGKDVMSRIRTADIRKMPHLLIAGTTGAGKSVFLKSLISSILLHSTPDEVRLALVDPKLVELGMFDGVPHLLSPVVKDMNMVVPLLQRAVNEMERRYQRFSELGVTDLEQYANLRQEKQTIQKDMSLENLPIIVIVIDELADLMDVASEETEKLIKRLAQKSRATGIHLVVATQRPSVDVITGTIKANLPTRLSFMVSSAVDSRTILDKGGAERLVGRGDMLFQAGDAPDLERIQGALIENEAVQVLVEYWREEAVRRVNGMSELPIDQKNLVQLSLDATWNLEPIEGEKPALKPKATTKEPVLREEQLYEHLTAFLLYDTVFVDGTPLPVPLRDLPFEDRLLVAEAVAWKSRGSAEKLNTKLRTRTGPELRDELVRRGLLDRDTQSPIRPSERLEPLLIECGFLDAESRERLDPLNKEETNQPLPDKDKQEADVLPT